MEFWIEPFPSEIEIRIELYFNKANYEVSMSAQKDFQRLKARYTPMKEGGTALYGAGVLVTRVALIVGSMIALD